MKTLVSLHCVFDILHMNGPVSWTVSPISVSPSPCPQQLFRTERLKSRSITISPWTVSFGSSQCPFSSVGISAYMNCQHVHVATCMVFHADFLQMGRRVSRVYCCWPYFIQPWDAMMNNLAREESWDLNPRQTVFLKSRKCYAGDRVPSPVVLPIARKKIQFLGKICHHIPSLRL